MKFITELLADHQSQASKKKQLSEVLPVRRTGATKRFITAIKQPNGFKLFNEIIFTFKLFYYLENHFKVANPVHEFVGSLDCQRSRVFHCLLLHAQREKGFRKRLVQVERLSD